MAHNKIDNRQVDMFQSTERYRIDKPIRLIELFAGYGSQALALKYLGVPFEHWCISEWAIKSIQAYKDLHFTDADERYEENMTDDEVLDWLDGKISSDYNTPLTRDQIRKKPYRTIYNQMKQTKNCGSITQMNADDLNIVDTDKYCYIVTYSYPCQAISLVGSQSGMQEGSGTTSSMLWEVGRLLKQCCESGNAPQVLLLENVPEILSQKNIDDFKKWLKLLNGFGYTSKYQIYNSTEFKVPQNRERFFMVSVHGEYDVPMPEPRDTQLCMGDAFETQIPEKYYLSQKTIDTYERKAKEQKERGNNFAFNPTRGGGHLKDHNGVQRGSDNGQLHYRRQYPLNPERDGMCRTLKAQYSKSSMANFVRSDSLGATGVIVIADTK